MRLKGAKGGDGLKASVGQRRKAKGGVDNIISDNPTDTTGESNERKGELRGSEIRSRLEVLADNIRGSIAQIYENTDQIWDPVEEIERNTNEIIKLLIEWIDEEEEALGAIPVAKWVKAKEQWLWGDGAEAKGGDRLKAKGQRPRAEGAPDIFVNLLNGNVETFADDEMKNHAEALFAVSGGIIGKKREVNLEG